MKATLYLAGAAFLIGACCMGHAALGNGGPFVVKHPHGDPAAKGVLARLDPTLKPTQETRLRVVKEDLTIDFGTENIGGDHRKMPPLVEVTAAYQIENPTDKEVSMDFGFPILRGIYLEFLMVPSPDVTVKVDKEPWIPYAMISNSVIYGMIRQNARDVIEKGIAADPELARRTAAVRAAWIVPPQPAPVQPPASQTAAVQKPKKAEKKGKANDPKLYSSDLDIPFTQSSWEPVTLYEAKPEKKKPPRKPTAAYLPARQNLQQYLIDKLGWNARDASLLVEYASLELGPIANDWRQDYPHDRWDICSSWDDKKKELDKIKSANLGPLAAIGEQKATQLFAQLAARFDPATAGTYEGIFTAWGGDVRERSIDLATGKIRPRELALVPPPATIDHSSKKPPPPELDFRLTADPTVYARVEYLDANATISAEEKASCTAVLKNLPVVFTFAPMNLLHYQVKFAPHATRAVTVIYKQHAYADTRGSGSYQLAYVLHPATFWKEFGPIQVTLHVPDGIACRASVPTEMASRERLLSSYDNKPYGPVVATYKTTLREPETKRGELFVGVDKAAWDKMFAPSNSKEISQNQK